jgi:hypothetical protein
MEPKEVRVTMRNLLAIGALCLVGSLAAELAAPTVAVPPNAQDLVGITQAEAAIGRGGGGGEGGGGNVLQIGPRTANLAKSIGVPLLFIFAAGGIAWAALERRAGAAVVVIVLSIVIGAFLLEPGQVKQTFISIYRYVL